MYLVIFDKSGKGLSGWHYEQLHEFEPNWIQQSTIQLEDRVTAEKLVKKLNEFGVQKIRIFKATEIIGILKDYEGS